MKKLICTIGTGSYKKVTYTFGERRKETTLAPVATGCCVVGAGEDLELVALLTRKAGEKYGDELHYEAERLGWTYTPVEIPDGKSEAELWEIFEKFGEHLKEGDEVVLDLTHGFRHLPALLLSAVQYYAVRKRIKILGVYYGAYEARDDYNNNAPIFDLTPLVDLPEWSYGVRLFSDYLLPKPLAEMLKNIQRRSHQPGSQQKFSRLQNVASALRDLEAPLASGIPLETGFEAHRTLDKARSAEEELSRLVPLRGFWKELKGQLTSFALPVKVPKGENPKKSVPLTIKELKRQARLVDGYLEVSNLRAAATLMRELIVSAVILHTQDPNRWLEREERQRAERRLGVIASWNRGASGLKKLLSDEQRELAKLWDQVIERRNDLAHAGMREDMVKFDDKALCEIHERIKANLANPDFWRTSIKSENERWLISPLGMTPGALYTAIVKEEPDYLFVITSEEAKEKIDEILAEADHKDLEVFCLPIGDPFNGFVEARDKVEQALREHGPRWAAAQEVIVNRTGGTTCLGWAVERIEAALRRDLGLEPRTVACIDRRSPEEQREMPYVEGEVIDITEPEEEE